MARQAITVSNVSRTAAERPAQQTSTTEMAIEGNDGRVILEIEAPEATEVSVPIPGKVDSQGVETLKFTVGAGKTFIVGPFPPSVYNQPDNSVYVNPNKATAKIRAYHV